MALHDYLWAIPVLNRVSVDLGYNTLAEKCLCALITWSASAAAGWIIVSGCGVAGGSCFSVVPDSTDNYTQRITHSTSTGCADHDTSDPLDCAAVCAARAISRDA